MTLWVALLTDLRENPLRMTFMVVNSIFPQILLSDLVCLVAGLVVNIVELVVHQSLI